MDYRIIDTTQTQLEQIEKIEQQCFSCPWTLDQLRSQLSDERHVFLAAVAENGAVLGYVGMMFVLDEGYISNVAVAPAYRRQGVADALISALMTRAEELNLAFVTLEVRAGNEPAKALYAKHGFVPVGRRKNYYDLPKEDAILMTRFWK
ncbi:MAG: ribosomal protein S18-alanine N-acetyltransferase [Candidatus Limivicinus sp.]|nr:ribosomal protein S18-alanine N-acetyltransferase [Candidatus Limivicinus sp.]